MWKWDRKVTTLVVIVILIAVAFIGTNFFGPKEIDPPQVSYTLGEYEDYLGTQKNSLGGEITLTSKMIYLLDANGYVVPVSMLIPYTESIAQQVLTYMVKGGPVEVMLPPGFSAPLPEGTTFTINIQDGVATVDFNKNFRNYDAEQEQAILEAITWALTEFETIDKVRLSINGEMLDHMPLAHTPVGMLSRENGINLELATDAVPGKTTAVTLYFEGEDPTGEFQYFVPVTRLIPQTQDVMRATLEELISGPKAGSGLVYSLNPTTKVLDTYITNGVAIVDFNEMIQGIADFDITGHSATRGLQSVVLSLAATHKVNRVQIMVNGEATLLTDSIDFTQPVSVPKNINAITS